MTKTSIKYARSVAVLAMLALLSVPAWAQEVSEKNFRPSIRATGESIVSAKPDQAQVQIGVVTQANTAEAAATQNAQKLDAALKALRNAIGPKAEIKTAGYSLNPTYNYPRDGGRPQITGYMASNIVEVTTQDLTQIGKIIDVATQNGANNIQSLQFSLKDDQAVRAQALREAALRAKAKAETLASALGLRVVRILSVEESGPAIVPLYGKVAAQEMRADVSTPVEPGNIEVRATVSLTVEISR